MDGAGICYYSGSKDSAHEILKFCLCYKESYQICEIKKLAEVFKPIRNLDKIQFL